MCCKTLLWAKADHHLPPQPGEKEERWTGEERDRERIVVLEGRVEMDMKRREEKRWGGEDGEQRRREIKLKVELKRRWQGGKIQRKETKDTRSGEGREGQRAGEMTEGEGMKSRDERCGGKEDA